ncbi:hypothetical protein GCM10020331_070080 [Ectobacillus funiculus]
MRKKNNPALIYGTYDVLLEEDTQIYAYTRTWKKNETILILTNISDQEACFILPANVAYTSAELLMSNHDTENTDIQNVLLQPYEARVYRLI